MLLARPARGAEREPLWTTGMRGAAPEARPGADPAGRALDAGRVTDVARPTLTWFIPGDADGRVLIVCPGGGYGVLAADKEGDAVGRRMASRGLSVAVLRYRVPCGNPEAADCAPRLDLAEAVRAARVRMKARGLPVRAVGAMGFSAGAHLALNAAYGPMPEGSARPDFVVAVYPAYLLERNGELKRAYAPAKDSPPACFVHAADDPFPAEGSVQLWRRLRGAGVPAELHVFDSGGHGFGLGASSGGGAASAWADLAQAWILRTAR